ncbi:MULTISPECIES: hypothetical protein [unclassified Streptomyces]|uniref:hypothetical protein n=1 Tax=unclassified Streptomyces TaxID=2593676 RepID=UPI00036F148D|nr:MULTISPECIES: hypothetical protein [unclassified Streptomyces]
MKIGPENNDVSLRRKWGVPLSVAAGVTAVSATAVVAFGGLGDAGPGGADPALRDEGPANAAASPRPGPTPASTGGAGRPSSAPVKTDPNGFTFINGTTKPIDTGSVTNILSSCLGQDASRFHAVIAVRTPIASKAADGVVVAANSAGKYVQCEAKGDKGSSPDSPPTFINDRLWGAGHLIEYFDASLSPAGRGKYVMVGAGHYTSDVAKVTVSYGDKPKQYPTVMAGGAFVYTAAIAADDPSDKHFPGPTAYVHAYDASGKEIYNQAKDPEFSADQ